MRRNPAIVSTIFLALLALALLALTHCQAPKTAREVALLPTYTRVPYTPNAEAVEIKHNPLPTVPATFTPETLSLLVGLSSGAADFRRAEATETPDLSGYTNVIVVRRIASPTHAPSLVPTAIQTPTSMPTASSTPTTIPTTATIAPVPTFTPMPPNSTSTPVPPPSHTPTRTPTSSPQPPSNSPTPQPTSTPNPKKGIAATFANRYENGHQPFSPSWYYTWTLNPGLWQGPEFIPMWPCRNTTPTQVIQALGADYDGYLLFLNEPDRVEQCHQTIDEAVDYYLMVRNTLPQAKLIGPQTINSTNLNFGAWTGAWRERVRQRTGSYPDVVGYGFHVYPYYNGEVTTRQAMQSWCDSLAEWGELGTKEIWVTEFGVHNFDGTPQEVQAELTGMLDLFENGMGSCQVDRYSYYTERRVLINGAPTPTIAPGGLNYWDLFWRNSWELSYTGQVYADH